MKKSTRIPPPRNFNEMGPEKIKAGLTALPSGSAAAETRTVGAERQRLQTDLFRDGAKCACCDQHVQLYRRPITGTMALILWFLHQYDNANPGAYVHVRELIETRMQTLPKRQQAASAGGDWCKLRHWGFIEPQPGVRDDGSVRNGYWRITADGKRFADGFIDAPSHAFEYNGAGCGLDGRVRVTFKDALGKKFNFNEIVGR